MSFTVRFDENNQEVVFGGVMRPKAADELTLVWETIDAAIRRISGTLFLNFRRLTKLNALAFRELAGMLGSVCHTQPELKVRVVFSSVVGWAARKFRVLGTLSPNIRLVSTWRISAAASATLRCSCKRNFSPRACWRSITRKAAWLTRARSRRISAFRK
jgi:hypothetical protein